MGWDKAEAFLRAHPEVHAVLLKENLEDALVSEALRNKIQPYDSNLRMHFVEQKGS